MLHAAYCCKRLHFKTPARTSRNVMQYKDTYFIKIWNDDNPKAYGLGECALFRGLSAEDRPDYENMLTEVCRSINDVNNIDISDYSSIRFGLETALSDLANGCNRCPFPSAWSKGIGELIINGLVWMGNADEMDCRAMEKLESGFRCIKFKIGGVDFKDEVKIIERIRKQYSPEKLQIRLDANGAFSTDDAITKLRRLSLLDIHSLEQPIKSGDWSAMADICANSPIDIALDEELIGINRHQSKKEMLQTIRPKYIILKPALCGGFSGAKEWIDIASAIDINWWATSALESNIGLNAIAQWVSTYHPTIPQGLGTGLLFTNNISSPLIQERDILRYNPYVQWIIPNMTWKTP